MTELRDQLQGTLGAAYSLERELGGGGMSRVFVATETSLGRTVVVKVLPPDLHGGVNIDRFRREARFAARLQHPLIIPVLAAGEMDGVPYYMMPFVEGQTLRARLREGGALPLGEAISILGDVAKALTYAHAHGVAHRDIKPDNVLLSGGVAVVTDFGIAKALSDSTTATGRTSLTMAGHSVGTPAYMAPEQAAADPATDHRADLYAFGGMAYELLTGEPPFARHPPHRVLAAQITERPAPIAGFRPDVPRALEALVMRCLEKDPANRPQSAEELTRALATVVVRPFASLEGRPFASLEGRPFASDERPAASLEGRPFASLEGRPIEPVAVPAALLVPLVLGKVMALYVAAAIAVLLLTRAAIVAIGLPDWVLTGALIVVGLGLPVVLRAAWLHYVSRRAATEAPTSPGSKNAAST